MIVVEGSASEAVGSLVKCSYGLFNGRSGLKAELLTVVTLLKH